MLKIKDNVDLKELEKYGYWIVNNIATKDIKKYFDDCGGLITISIKIKYKMIFLVKKINSYNSVTEISLKFGFFKRRKYLKELRKDGLVEKVEK